MLDLFTFDEEKKKEFDLENMGDIDVQYGDIFEVDGHRIMCGDSTKLEDIKKLIKDVKIDLLFTDPPYNVGFNGRSGNFEIIMNDKLSSEQFEIFIDKIINNIKVIKPESYYIWCNWKFYGILQNKIDYKACIVWAKNVFGMGQGYRHQHEFCLFGGHIHNSIKNESDLWFFDKDNIYLHPTQKPVGLSIRGIKNSTKKTNNVLDLFGGSGSTLLGCEYTNRNGYIMELDPYYVKVILNRFEYTFGKKWVKVNE